MLRADFRFGDNHRVPLVAFAHPPTDARSACIVVLDGEVDVPGSIETCRQIGAPVLFACRGPVLEWWSIHADSAERLGPAITCEEVPAFFDRHSADFSPDAVYRAKTWGRFSSEYQLRFVDVGLMPLVEDEAGVNATLASAIERCPRASTCDG